MSGNEQSELVQALKTISNQRFELKFNKIITWYSVSTITV